jgi:hypothetical protein
MYASLQCMSNVFDKTYPYIRYILYYFTSLYIPFMPIALTSHSVCSLIALEFAICVSINRCSLSALDLPVQCSRFVDHIHRRAAELPLCVPDGTLCRGIPAWAANATCKYFVCVIHELRVSYIYIYIYIFVFMLIILF